MVHDSAQGPLCLPMKHPHTQPGFPRKDPQQYVVFPAISMGWLAHRMLLHALRHPAQSPLPQGSYKSWSRGESLKILDLGHPSTFEPLVLPPHKSCQACKISQLYNN